MFKKFKIWKQNRRNIKIAKKIIKQEQWRLDMLNKIDIKKHEIWNLKWKSQDDDLTYFILEQLEIVLNNLQKELEEEK